MCENPRKLVDWVMLESLLRLLAHKVLHSLLYCESLLNSELEFNVHILIILTFKYI